MRSHRHVAAAFGLLLTPGCGADKSAAPVPIVRLAEGDERGAIEQEQASGATLTAPREQVENPQYASWAAFAPGTKAVLRSVTETAGNSAVTTTTKTYRLVSLTSEHAVIDITVRTKRYDGAAIDNPPERFTFPKLMPLPPGVVKADFGKPSAAQARGEESVTIGDKAYSTTWHEGKDRNEAGEVFVKVWTSPAVPGGLVKSVSRIPDIGKSTTIELVEVVLPPTAARPVNPP
jgi:hypothetical protein